MEENLNSSAGTPASGGTPPTPPPAQPEMNSPQSPVLAAQPVATQQSAPVSGQPESPVANAAAAQPSPVPEPVTSRAPENLPSESTVAPAATSNSTPVIPATDSTQMSVPVTSTGSTPEASPKPAEAQTPLPIVSRETNLPPVTPAPWRKTAIGIGAVIIIAAIIWYAVAQRQNTDNNADGTGPNITVSSEREEGTVTITEEPLVEDTATGSGTIPPGMVEITAYYSNTKKDPGAKNCGEVYPLKRLAERKYNSDIINTARGLLLELTDAEKSDGWVSSIPSGVLLKSISIVDGVATANFTSNLNRAAGSCAVTAARAQIEQTIKQLPGVRTVKICADGDCNQVLQP